MKFTTSDGYIITEGIIQDDFFLTIKDLKQKGYADVLSWEKEFLKWFLEKEIGYKQYIELHKDITEDELKQLEQFINFLGL